MTNEGEAFGKGELCPIDGIKGQKNLCTLCAFAVNAFSTAETQKNNKRKNLCVLCAFAVKNNSTAETQKNNKREKPSRSLRLCG